MGLNVESNSDKGFHSNLGCSNHMCNFYFSLVVEYQKKIRKMEATIQKMNNCKKLGNESISFIEDVKKLKFGDKIINNHAGVNNFHRIGIVVQITSEYILLTDGENNLWKLVNDKQTNITLLGNMLIKPGSFYEK